MVEAIVFRIIWWVCWLSGWPIVQLQPREQDPGGRNLTHNRRLDTRSNEIEPGGHEDQWGQKIPEQWGQDDQGCPSNGVRVPVRVRACPSNGDKAPVYVRSPSNDSRPPDTNGLPR